MKRKGMAEKREKMLIAELWSPWRPYDFREIKKAKRREDGIIVYFVCTGYWFTADELMCRVHSDEMLRKPRAESRSG